MAPNNQNGLHYEAPFVWLHVCWQEVLTGFQKAEKMLAARSGASAENAEGRASGKCSLKQDAQGPELTLKASVGSRQRLCWKRGTRTQSQGELCGKERKLSVFIILFALTGHITVPGPKYLLFFSFPLHRPPPSPPVPSLICH